MSINVEKWGGVGNSVAFRTNQTPQAVFMNLRKDRGGATQFTGMATGVAAWAYLNEGIGRTELWDPSICFWGAGAGKYGNGRTCFDYKHTYTTAGGVTTTDTEIVSAPDAIPLSFGAYYPGYASSVVFDFKGARTQTTSTPEGIYQYHAIMPEDNHTGAWTQLLNDAENAVPDFLELQICPMYQYTISDIKMLIVVQASNGRGYGTGTANYIECDLPEYERQMSNYPYILGVELRPFAKGATGFNAIDWNNQEYTRGLGMLTIYTPTISSGAQISEPLTVYGRQHLGASAKTIKGYNSSDPTTPWTYNNCSRGINIGGTGLGSTYTDSFTGFDGNAHRFIPGGDRWTVLENASQYAYHGCYWEISTQADFEELKNYCMQSAAFVGLPFTEKYEDLRQTAATTDTHMGLRDEYGNTTGQWVSGSEIAQKIPAYSWTDPNTQSTYDPYHPAGEDPNKYITEMTNKQYIDIKNFYRLYGMAAGNVEALNGYLAYLPTLASTYAQFSDYQLAMSNKFLNSNPIDNIIFLKWYPCDLKKYCFISPTSQPVKISNAQADYPIGGVTFTVHGYTSDTQHLINTLYLGNFDIYAAYNNFLDYEPFSAAKLYLPYAATVDIDMKQIINKKIYVQYKVDFRTGTATAYVTQNSYQGIVIATAPAHISVDIPVTGVQSADYQNALYQAVSNLKQATAAQFTAYMQTAATAITSAVAGAANPLTLFGGAARTAGAAASVTAAEQRTADAKYKIDTAPIRHTLVNATTAGDAAIMYQYPALIITRPKMLDTYDAEIYSKTVGNAVIAQMNLSDAQGFTVVSDIDTTGITATQTEINQIKNILAQGAYL